MRTSTRLDCPYTIRGQGLVLQEEFLVFTREDVVCRDGDVVCGSETATKG